MADTDETLDPELMAYVEERLGHSLDDDAQEPPEEDDEEQDGTNAPDDAEETDEVDDDAEPPEPPSAGSAPTDDDSIEVEPGITLTRAQAKSYYEFDAILRGDQELLDNVDKLIRGKQAQTGGAGAAATPPPPSAPAPLPELTEDDLEDPTIRALYETAQADRARLAEHEARIRELTDVTITREHEEIQQLVSVTKESFANARNLTPEEMDRVEAVALRLNVVPALMQGVDPITGATEPRDRATALNRAFEIAYYYLPETRARDIDTAVAERAKTTRRKQKLAGVGGSSGSVPKGTGELKTATDRRNAMIAEVAGFMGQTNETE